MNGGWYGGSWYGGLWFAGALDSETANVVAISGGGTITVAGTKGGKGGSTVTGGGTMSFVGHRTGEPVPGHEILVERLRREGVLCVSGGGSTRVGGLSESAQDFETILFLGMI